MTDDAASVSVLKERVPGLMAGVRADLEDLVAIPSVNFPGYPPEPVARCAERVAELLADAGAPDVRLVDSGGVGPAIRADIPGPPGSPTVLLYSHYDVQPGGDGAKWESDPFAPQVRDGRLYGRGAADDKSGVVTHIATLRAFDGRPPVGLRILLEGEEEYGGPFEDWPRSHPEAFAGVTAAVIDDMGPVELGVPTFTTALRGVVAATVSVRTLAEPRHSGMFGGPTPDALMVLIKLLATLLDDRGDPAVASVPSGTWPGAEYPEGSFREVTGFLPGVPRIGTHDIASHLYAMPSITVIGLDAPAVDTAPNAIIPSARAKISMRIPPGVDHVDAMARLREHVATHVPWGVEVEFEPLLSSNGTLVPTGGPAFGAFARAMAQAYGREPVEQGAGGAIPFVANLLAEFPGIEVFGVGAQDPLARIHAPNESIDLAELERAVLAQVLFLAELG